MKFKQTLEQARKTARDIIFWGGVECPAKYLVSEGEPCDSSTIHKEDCVKPESTSRDTKYIPVDPSRPCGFFTVPEFGEKECKHEWYQHSLGTLFCRKCAVLYWLHTDAHPLQKGTAKKMSATEASFYGLEREKKDIERVAEWLLNNTYFRFWKGNKETPDSVRKDLAEKLLEAGLDPARLK